jgi:hypothetical protein
MDNLTTTHITGRTAITVADLLGVQLRKHADPTDGAREIADDEARRICGEDPALVYVDSSEVAEALADDDIHNLRADAGRAGDPEQVALCDAALAGSTPALVACARAIADAHASRS